MLLGRAETEYSELNTRSFSIFNIESSPYQLVHKTTTNNQPTIKLGSFLGMLFFVFRMEESTVLLA
jgi:hypothetical protein